MSTLSPAQLVTIRSHPHTVDAKLSVIVPETVYCGKITGSPDRGAIEITVTDVSGNIGNVKEGQTVYVGTSCGLYDISKRRLRRVNGNVLTLDESSLIWDNSWYLTVVKNWELWPMYPYISGTAGNYTFYKDRDIAYSDQNEKPYPVAIMGWHRAVMLTGSDITVNLIGTNSYAVASGASISSYLWECDSGVIASANAATTTIKFASAGQYWVKLTVTDSNGKTQSTYRIVVVHDESNMPYTDFVVSRLSGAWSSGGWDADITVYGDATQDDFPDGALMILWADQQYGDGTEVDESYDVLFVGYLDGESVIINIDTGEVQFSAHTIHTLLNNCNMYSVSITAVDGTPSTWNEYTDDLTTARALHHYLRWHSTLFSICDVYLPVDSTLTMPAQDFESGVIYNVIDTFAYQRSIFAHVCSDKHGVLHIERDVQTLSDSERAALTVVMAITDEDRVGDEVVLELLRNPITQTYLVNVSGIDNDKNPYIAQAPGYIPNVYGNTVASFPGLALSDQSHANYLAGRLYAVANKVITEIRMPLAGNYSFMDLVPQEWYTLSISAASNKRGIVLAGANTVIRDINIQLNVVDGLLSQEIVTEVEVDAYDGVKLDVPLYDPPDYPDPPIPEIPPWSPPLPQPPNLDGHIGVFVVSDTGIYYTPDILAADTVWVSVNTGIPSVELSGIYQLYVDVRHTDDDLVVNLYAIVNTGAYPLYFYSKIYRADNVFNIPLKWIEVQTIVSAGLSTPTPNYVARYRAIAVNPLNANTVMVLKTSRCYGAQPPCSVDVTHTLYYSSDKCETLDAGYSLTQGYNAGKCSITYKSDGEALVSFIVLNDSTSSAYAKYVVTNDNGKTATSVVSISVPYTISFDYDCVHDRKDDVICSVISPLQVFPATSNSLVYKSSDGGTSFIAGSVDWWTSLYGGQRVAISNTGKVLVVNVGRVIYISSDGGSTFTQVLHTDVPITSALYIVKAVNYHNGVLFAGSNAIYYSDDDGITLVKLNSAGLPVTYVISQLHPVEW